MTTEARPDPDVPLAGPPEPWASTEAPARRLGPPWHMTDMIAAEPALARRTLERLAAPDGAASLLAQAIAETARAGGSIVVTGCGTSEHGALGAADILRDAIRAAGLPGPGPVAVQAFELALDPPGGGLVIGISHEGGTWATNAALAAARTAGSRTALVTVTSRSPGAALADIVVETGELDQSWCHTIGYVAPLLAATAVGGHLLGRAVDSSAVSNLLADGMAQGDRAERIASQLADAGRILVIASGADRTAGRELVLKIEEATWVPAAYRDLETFLHGHFPATGPDTRLVLILADRSSRQERVARARGALRAAGVLGIRVAAILAAGIDGELDPGLTPAGRLLASEAPTLPAAAAALFGTATPLQLLTERLARARGTDPDPIRRDDPRFVDAADAVEDVPSG